MLLYLLSDGLDHDKPFGRNTTLPAIDQPACRADTHCRLDIRVGENNVRITATEFQYRLFDQSPRLAGHRLAGRGAARQGDRLDQGVRNHCIDLGTTYEERFKEMLWESSLVEKLG